MRVQLVRMQESGMKSWTLLDDDWAAVTVGLLQLLDRHNVIGVHPHERGTSVVDSSAIQRDKGHVVNIASGQSSGNRSALSSSENDCQRPERVGHSISTVLLRIRSGSKSEASLPRQNGRPCARTTRERGRASIEQEAAQPHASLAQLVTHRSCKAGGYGFKSHQPFQILRIAG